MNKKNVRLKSEKSIFENSMILHANCLILLLPHTLVNQRSHIMDLDQQTKTIRWPL